ncbi:MAG: suppressor of fused domain protein [Crocinitomicaceae bacterium]|nr:suppressor of fused domain protein [Crocinitomicaceae bacterium]
MKTLSDCLKERFGDNRVLQVLDNEQQPFRLLELALETKVPIRVFITDGLSERQQPTPKESNIPEFIELAIALPEYWDFEDLDNPKWNWPLEWLLKIANYQLENPEKWLAHGHTFSSKTEVAEGLSFSHFILTDPIELEAYLYPIELKDKTVQILVLFPLFENEFIYKNNKGSFKFLRKYRVKNGNEIIDSFRQSAMHRKWGIF